MWLIFIHVSLSLSLSLSFSLSLCLYLCLSLFPSQCYFLTLICSRSLNGSPLFSFSSFHSNFGDCPWPITEATVIWQRKSLISVNVREHKSCFYWNLWFNLSSIVISSNILNFYINSIFLWLVFTTNTVLVISKKTHACGTIVTSYNTMHSNVVLSLTQHIGSLNPKRFSHLYS